MYPILYVNIMLFYASNRRGNLWTRRLSTGCARCMFTWVKKPSTHPRLQKYYHTRLPNCGKCSFMSYSYIFAIMQHTIGFYTRSDTVQHVGCDRMWSKSRAGTVRLWGVASDYCPRHHQVSICAFDLHIDGTFVQVWARHVCMHISPSPSSGLWQALKTAKNSLNPNLNKAQSA